MRDAPSPAGLRGALVALPAAVLLAGCAGIGSSSHSRATVVSGGASPVVARPVARRRPRRLARLTLAAALPHRVLVVPILMYHRVDRVGDATSALERSLTVTPASFAAQMRWLVGHGFHAVSQRQLYEALEAGRPLPRRPVMITFDDGYADVFRRALPVLRRLGLRATAYVITDRISTRLHQFLTWPELHALEAGGVEIGSHTHSHLDLTSLDDAAVTDELVRSRKLLERHLGHPVQWLSYPAGRVDARVERLARRAGYVLAVTTDPGDRQSAAAPLLLERLRVTDGMSLAGLALAG